MNPFENFVPGRLFGTDNVNIYLRRKIRKCGLKDCGRWARGDYCCDRCYGAHLNRRNPAEYLRLLAIAHTRDCTAEQALIWGDHPNQFVADDARTRRWRSCETVGCNRARDYGSSYCCPNCTHDMTAPHTQTCTAGYERLLRVDAEVEAKRGL